MTDTEDTTRTAPEPHAAASLVRFSLVHLETRPASYLLEDLT